MKCLLCSLIFSIGFASSFSNDCRSYSSTQKYPNLIWSSAPTVSIVSKQRTDLVFCIGYINQSIKRVHIYDSDGGEQEIESAKLINSDYVFVKYEYMPSWAKLLMRNQKLATLQLNPRGPKGHYSAEVKMPDRYLRGLRRAKIKSVKMMIQIDQSNNVVLSHNGKVFEHFEPTMSGVKLGKLQFLKGGRVVSSVAVSELKNTEYK